MSNQAFSQERIGQCVQILDEMAQSGLGAQAFAQARGLSYTQLRAWRNHEARWRARLDGREAPKPTARASGFVQLSPAKAATDARARASIRASIRIECAQGARSAVLHWPSDAPLQCAQWLSAYLA